MDDSEDVKKIEEIIRKHKIEAEDPDELEYAEFIDYSESNDGDDTIEIEDYEIPEFSKSDITKFHTYTPAHFLTEEERNVVESCPDPDLKQLLLLNRNKNLQLMQLYKKIKDLLEECQKNMSLEQKFISDIKQSKRVYNRIWRLGIPYFKSKDDFPCPRNEDIVRKHRNGELHFYDMTPSNKWVEKDMNRLIKGIAFHYKIYKEKTLENKIKLLEQDIAEGGPDAEKEELIQELKNEMEDLKNSETNLYPPLGNDKYMDWNRIAEYFLKDRYSAQDCQIFWNTYLHPDINKGPWTPEENLRIKFLVGEYNVQNWDLIAAELGNNRTGFVTCVHYFCKINPPRQGRFTTAEDKLLCDLVEQHRQGEYIPWTKIAHHFKERTRGQLFYRYKYFLSCRNGKVKGKFSEAEDILILVLVDRFGKRFTKCGQYFSNRSVVQIKARYSSNLRGAIKKGSFTVEEDQEILKYAAENGTSSWEPLVKRINRCGGQIRQRYKTLRSFFVVHPELKLDNAPRRRFSGISYDTEFDFLRCMADKFKNCEKIPTLQDIEKLLEGNPKPKAHPLEPLAKEKLAPREPRSRKDRKEKVDENVEKNIPKKEKPTQTKKENKQETGKLPLKGPKVRPRRTKKPFPEPECDSDVDDTFPTLNLSVDNLLIEFFSNSMKLNFEQSVSGMHIQRAAAVVTTVLSTLQAELYIPKDFQDNPQLDTIDVGILKILTVDRPITMSDDYVIGRTSSHIDRLVPPNLNTIVGMRSLLIKNQIYKSKHAKRAYIFEDFKTECKEKQVLWCINNHLSNQSQDIQNDLVAERCLFFKRFVSLFKFPAIMTLQRPSDSLETGSKLWRDKFTTVVKTYTKKPRQAPTQERKDNPTFEVVFIKQQPQDEYENGVGTSHHVSIGGDDITNEIDVTKTSQPEMKSCKGRDTALAPKLSIVDQLKRRISDTIDELTNSPPTKKFYGGFTPIQVKAPVANVKAPVATKTYKSKQTAQQVAAPLKKASRSVNPDQNRNKSAHRKDNVVLIKSESAPDVNPADGGAHGSFKTYKSKQTAQQVAAPLKKASRSVNPDQNSNKSAHRKDNVVLMKSDTVPDVNPADRGAHGSFNMSRGELVLVNDWPRNSTNGSDTISQDLLDLNVLNAVLKKEMNLEEESFDF